MLRPEYRGPSTLCALRIPARPAQNPCVASPFLKWAGGKGRLVPVVASAEGLFESERFIEPFLGGGAMLFGLKARGFQGGALAADLNGDLVETFIAVRDATEALIEALESLAGEYARLDAAGRARLYYEVRASRPAGPVERAARLIFLNRTCYNGLYRVNRAGHFNVPHGSYRNPRICDADGLRECARDLRGAAIRAADFEEICGEAGAGDFVYLDPPYQPLSKTASFTSYTDNPFGPAEQARLARVVRELDARGARFVLSNSALPGIAELYRGFRIVCVDMARNINSIGARRQPVAEFLISNVEVSASGPERAAEPARSVL